MIVPRGSGKVRERSESSAKYNVSGVALNSSVKAHASPQRGMTQTRQMIDSATYKVCIFPLDFAKYECVTHHSTLPSQCRRVPFDTLRFCQKTILIHSRTFYARVEIKDIVSDTFYTLPQRLALTNYQTGYGVNLVSPVALSQILLLVKQNGLLVKQNRFDSG